jgi:hypothetical protein
MPNQKWDTWAFQNRLLRLIEDKERYRSEHRERIRRGQSNGNPRMRDDLTGEIAAMEALLGGGDTPHAEHMAKKIEAKLEAAPPPNDVEFPESYANGWKQGLNEALGYVKPYLSPVD